MSADRKYLEKRKSIDKELKILKQKLEAMDMDQKRDNKNWGFAGNADHILEIIFELNYGFMDNY